MAPKKKKKSAKTKMSDEERIAYEEQKHLADEEMRKKKEDLLTQFLKDKLTKEEKATRFNLNKLNHQWRNIMRESKARELKKDIEILSQTFERVVDRKDAVIKSLAKDISEAEEQHAMAQRSYLQNLDALIELQRQRLDLLKQEYDTELEIVKFEFDTERSLILDKDQDETTDIDDILFAMDQNFQETENDAKAEFQSMRDEIKNKNLEEKHALRVALESKVDDLWQQFSQALQNYNETTEERKSAFESFKDKDEKSAKEIDLQMRKLQRISDQMAALKSKMATNAKECDERNKMLKEDREKMLAHFQEMKAQMNKLRDGEHDKLTKLTLESNAAMKELTRLKEKGDQNLVLAEMCRKLETEEEKVLPFYASSLTQKELDNVEEAILEEPMEPLVKIMHEYASLDNFWKRYNKVLLDKLSLDKEKQKLMQENHQLRTLLKQYLDGISVNDEILTQVNPLFIVNNKTNVKLNIPVGDPRVHRPAPQTVVEAAHVLKHILN